MSSKYDFKKRAIVIMKSSKTKYVVAFILFFLIMFIFDPNNIPSRVLNKFKIEKLKREIAYFEEKIELDKQKMKELNSEDNIEKFAREEFLMKKPNEEIFIIEE